jgi:quercetin dioxygenase-like cupin family protein
MKSRISCAATSVVAVLAIVLTGSHLVRAQVTPLQIMALALGSSDDNIQLHVKGPSDVLQTLLVFQPNGETGWHMHPGPVVVIVKSGTLTEIHSNGCLTVHPAGSAFFETKGEIHNAINRGGVVAEVYATFLSPAGAQPLIPVSDPGRVCHHDKE